MRQLWDTIIEPLLTAADARNVVEIGSERGETTLPLLAYCRARGGTLHAIDPQPCFPVAEWEESHHNTFSFHRARSLDILPQLSGYDAVLIDGDHNWHTVFRELTLIEESGKKNGDFPLILLHDTAWPYGRRDVYYAPEEIPADARHRSARSGLHPDSDSTIGLEGMCPDLWNACKEGGPRNGVRTAVEDFLSASTEQYLCQYFDGFFGLCLLCHHTLPERHPSLSTLLHVLQPSDALAAHIRAVERNRVLAIIDRQRTEHSQREAECAQKEAEHSQREAECAQKEAEHSQREAECAQKEAEHSQREAECAQKEAEHSQREIADAMAHMRRTRSWRWTGPFRSVEAQWHILIHSCVYGTFGVLKKLWAKCGYPPPHFTRKVRHQWLWWWPVRSGFYPHTVASTLSIFISRPRPVDIIIPIHNAFEVTTRCIESVLAYTTDVPHRLLLIDDASTDPRMRPYLEDIQHRHPSRVCSLFLPENRGFVRTVNYALPLTTSHDVVLLNSDTEVSPYWLSGLARICGEKEDVGTVTPLSNKASIYSIMEPAWANVMLRRLGVADIGATVRNHTLRLCPEIPTAVGFCMYMKREAIDRIGFFDEEFGYGYGEENDWCMRARAAGFRHYLDDATFVYHEGHVSMRAAGHLPHQEEHREDHEIILQRKHPTYRTVVHSFLKNDQHLHRIRQHLHHFLIEKVSAGRRRLALLVHRPIDGSCIGGTEFNVRDLVEGLQGHIDCFVVFPKDNTLVVQRLVDNCTVSYVFPIPPSIDREAVLAKTFGSILDTFCIELLHVHHTMDTSFRLIGVAKERGMRVLYTVHDFFALSPNYHLAREDGTYHGVPDDGETYGRSNEETYGNWRKHVRQYLQQVDAITAPSQSALTLFDSIYGDLPATRHIVEHGDNFEPLPHSSFPSMHRICFLGAVHEVHKGRNIVLPVAKYLAQQGINLVFLGCHADDFTHALSPYKNISFLGFYARDDILTILQSQQISLVCLLSPFPETFSHTLSESWLARIPVYVTNTGAFAERVGKTHAGKVAPSIDPMEIAKDICDFLHSPEYRDVWQRVQELQLKTSAEMTEEYLPLYKDLFPQKV